MGGWASRAWWGGEPDAPLPVSGLSLRELYAVESSWATVYAQPLHNGTLILNKLFQAHPEIKEYFKMLRDVPEAEYSSNIQFRAHVTNLMGAMNLAVVNLRTPEVVVVMMNKVGASHRSRGVKQRHFEDLRRVLIATLTEVLKQKRPTVEAWDKMIQFLYKNIFDTLNVETSR